MEHTRLPKCVMFGELMGGAGCVGGQEKEWMGCLPDDLRSFDINADQWTAAAQDEGEWRKTAEQGAGRFIAKWIIAEKARARLRDAVVVYLNVMGRTKERLACAGSLEIVYKHFVLFRFPFLLSLNPRPFARSFFAMAAPRQPDTVS